MYIQSQLHCIQVHSLRNATFEYEHKKKDLEGYLKNKRKILTQSLCHNLFGRWKTVSVYFNPLFIALSLRLNSNNYFICRVLSLHGTQSAFHKTL
uniref:Uncharacterized protein n=1 Tax=Anguilla anguilla TaxID=7936 RepID=A0A0E9X635_ANGAN